MVYNVLKVRCVYNGCFANNIEYNTIYRVKYERKYCIVDLG